MPPLSSYQLLAATVAGLIGYAFRLGLTYEKSQKLPSPIKMVFMAFFSFGSGALMQLWAWHAQWEFALGLLSITAASFFGPVVLPGAGNIDAAFFTEIIKELLRKWVNAPKKNNHDQNLEEEDVEQ